MTITARLLRALALVWLVFASYAVQFGLERLFGGLRVTPPPGSAGGREAEDAAPGDATSADSTSAIAPGWLARRRARVHERNAERLLRGMLSLRGVYIKLGQVLSVMVGLLPPVYRRTLSRLQDQVPPRPFAEIERVFTRSLGKPPSACLREIDPHPIAAASLGQVHLARLPDGSEVAIKLLYPNIRAVIAVDLRVLRFAMHLFRGIIPLRDLQTVHAALVDLLARETDYLHEAACMKRVARAFEGRKDVQVPEVIDALTSADVLTMTRMHGVKVGDAAALRAEGIEPDAVGKLILSSFLDQLFVHREFQSDPHPGNYLVHKTASGAPRLVILDFGAMCQAPPALVEGMIDALLAVVAQDGARLHIAIERMGFVAEDGDRELAQRAVLHYFGRLMQLRRHSAKALAERKPGELRRLLDPELELSELRALAHAFQLPPGWFYVERALLMMFGLVGSVAPELDLVRAIYPHLMPLLAARTQTASRQSAE